MNRLHKELLEAARMEQAREVKIACHCEHCGLDRDGVQQAARALGIRPDDAICCEAVLDA